MTHEQQSSGSLERGRRIAGGTITLLGVLVGVFLLLSSCQEKRAEKKERQHNESRAASRIAAIEASTPVVYVSIWKICTFERIPPGGLTVYLYPGWKTFPLGGTNKIITPSGKVIRDEPGVHQDIGYMEEGNYIIRPSPENAQHGVEIYNQWKTCPPA